MAYSVFVSTHQFKSKKTADSPNAGASKVSAVTARSKSELQALGEKLGYTACPLTMADIRAMSSQEMLWHESENSENYKAAFAVEENKKNNKVNIVGWDARRMWEGRATE